MTEVPFTVELTLEDDEARENLATHIELIAEELAKLDVIDPFVGANLENGEIEIHFILALEDKNNAFQEALNAVQTALQASGGGWQFEKVAKDRELVQAS